MHHVHMKGLSIKQILVKKQSLVAQLSGSSAQDTTLDGLFHDICILASNFVRVMFRYTPR